MSIMGKLLQELQAKYLWARAKATVKPRKYHFQARYVPILGTERHCHIHPRKVATSFELNTQDKSYRRAVCADCAAT